MNIKQQQLVLIGAGNLATQLGQALCEQGFSVRQVYSHTILSASILGNLLQATFTNTLEEVVQDADIYIFAVKDTALPEVLKQLPSLPGLFVHTAGSVPLQVFEKYSERCGVLYPLQTFSKSRKVAFESIPLFIESNNSADESKLFQLASSLSSQVTVLSSEKRKHLHLAAVVASNFTNCMYTLAAKILHEQELPWEVLIPLIKETAAKAGDTHPLKAQTGPAIRRDTEIINKHLALLKNHPEIQELYEKISDLIFNLSVSKQSKINTMKPILLATLSDNFKANVLRGALHNEGIETFLKNETLSSVLPGFQIEIHVFEKDYERAMELFKKGFPDLANE